MAFSGAQGTNPKPQLPIYLPPDFNCDHFEKLIKVYNAIVQFENVPYTRVEYQHFANVDYNMVLLFRHPDVIMSDYPSLDVVHKILADIINSHYTTNLNEFEMRWLNGTYKAYKKQEEDRVAKLMQRYADKPVNPDFYGKVQMPGGKAIQYKATHKIKLSDLRSSTYPDKHDVIILDHFAKIKDNDPDDYMSPDKLKSIMQDQYKSINES